MTELKLREEGQDYTKMLCTYYNENGFQEKYLRFNKEKFELTGKIAPPVRQTAPIASCYGNQGEDRIMSQDDDNWHYHDVFIEAAKIYPLFLH